MLDLQTLSNIAGLISFVAVVIGGFFFMKSNVGKQTSDAQQNAISALQAEVQTLRGRIADTEKENIKLQQTLDTICSALKIRGLVVSIQGEMINIADQNGSTTTRIHGPMNTP